MVVEVVVEVMGVGAIGEGHDRDDMTSSLSSGEVCVSFAFFSFLLTFCFLPFSFSALVVPGARLVVVVGAMDRVRDRVSDRLWVGGCTASIGCSAVAVISSRVGVVVIENVGVDVRVGVVARMVV